MSIVLLTLQIRKQSSYLHKVTYLNIDKDEFEIQGFYV